VGGTGRTASPPHPRLPPEKPRGRGGAREQGRGRTLHSSFCFFLSPSPSLLCSPAVSSSPGGRGDQIHDRGWAGAPGSNALCRNFRSVPQVQLLRAIGLWYNRGCTRDLRVAPRAFSPGPLHGTMRVVACDSPHARVPVDSAAGSGRRLGFSTKEVSIQLSAVSFQPKQEDRPKRSASLRGTVAKNCLCFRLQLTADG